MYTSIVLGNHPVKLTDQRVFFFFLRFMFVKVLQNESWRTVLEILVLPFCKQKISQAGFVRLEVIRSEAPELDFLLLN